MSSTNKYPCVLVCYLNMNNLNARIIIASKHRSDQINRNVGPTERMNKWIVKGLTNKTEKRNKEERAIKNKAAIKSSEHDRK